MKKRKLNVEESTKLARAAGKTRHQAGYHKKIKNPSTNYVGDVHKAWPTTSGARWAPAK